MENRINNFIANGLKSLEYKKYQGSMKDHECYSVPLVKVIVPQIDREGLINLTNCKHIPKKKGYKNKHPSVYIGFQKGAMVNPLSQLAKDFLTYEVDKKFNPEHPETMYSMVRQLVSADSMCFIIYFWFQYHLELNKINAILI